jgi:transposase
MGRQPPCQPKLFYQDINLEKRIPPDHILREIKEKIDFDFIYAEVEDSYGENGNVSVPPPVILKMMFLLIFYNVRSERELMNMIPLRLDWLWFLGYDLDSEVPNHSVLSKARARWGVRTFGAFLSVSFGNVLKPVWLMEANSLLIPVSSTLMLRIILLWTRTV